MEDRFVRGGEVGVRHGEKGLIRRLTRKIEVRVYGGGDGVESGLGMWEIGYRLPRRRRQIWSDERAEMLDGGCDGGGGMVLQRRLHLWKRKVSRQVHERLLQ